MLAPNDRTLRSFLPVSVESHFPIQNLPFGSFTRRGDATARIGVAIGEFVLDLRVLAESHLLKMTILPDDFFRHQETLNDFMSRGAGAWRETRAAISYLLRHDTSALRDNHAVREHALVPQADVRMLLPARIENYTDFYSSREHATNVGTMLRGAKRLDA